MTSSEEKNIAWKDIDFESSLQREDRKEEKMQGPPFLKRIPLVPILIALLILVLLAGGIGLYAGLSRLTSEVTVLQGKLVELNAANQKLRSEVEDLTRRLEALKGQRREKAELESRKAEPPAPKPAPAKKPTPAPAKTKKPKDQQRH
jgi:cell division protein FtsB